MVWKILIILKRSIRRIFNVLGFDVVQTAKKDSLLGLHNLPIRTVIDIGANEGQFTRQIRNIFPEAHIYSFEPIEKPFRKLRKWAEKEGEKVTVFNVALGEKEGNIEMMSHLDYSPSSSILKTTEVCETLYPFTKKQDTTTVTITTLDKVIADIFQPLSPEILIKLDVQGYENRVIKGGLGTFKKAKACILEVNFDKLYENQATFEDILSLLGDLGYRYVGNLEQVFAKDGHIIFADAVFIKQG